MNIDIKEYQDGEELPVKTLITNIGIYENPSDISTPEVFRLTNGWGYKLEEIKKGIGFYSKVKFN